MKKVTLILSVFLTLIISMLPEQLFSQDDFPDWHQSIEQWVSEGNDTLYNKYYDSATLAWWRAYVLQTYNLMYEVDGDTTWLHKLAENAFDIMRNARDFPEDTSIAYDPRIADGYFGWGTDRYSSDGKYTEYMVHEGNFSIELADFVLKVYQNEELYDFFGTRADSILHFFEKNVAGKWYAVWDSNRVANPDNVMDAEYPNWVGIDNIAVIPVNQYAALGHFILKLIEISQTSHYTPYNDNFLPWYTEAVNELAVEFRSSLHYLPDINAYTWKYAKGCCENDVSHSAIDVMFAYELYKNDIEFNYEDMTRFANFFVKHLWKNPHDVWNAEIWDFFNKMDSDGSYDKNSRKWTMYALFNPLIGGISSGIYRQYAIDGGYGSPTASGIAALAWINKNAKPLVSPVVLNISEKTGDGDNIPDPGEEINFFVGMLNYANVSIDSLIIDISCRDDRIEIIKGSLQYPPIASMDTAYCLNDTFSIKIKDDINNGGRIPIRISTKYKNKMIVDSLTILINPAKILLVDDDNGENFEKYYINGVLDSIATYIVWDVTKRGNPDLFLNKYEKIIWFTGDDSVNTLTAGNREAIKEYLDNDGKFILFSSKAQEDLLESDQPDSSFFENYLHTLPNDSQQTNDYFTLHKVDPRIYPSIYMPLTPKNNKTFRAINKKEENGVLVEYLFGVAGIYTLSEHRMAYFTFGVENVKASLDEQLQAERRRIFLSGILDILDETTALEQSDKNIPDEFQLSAYPNPFNSQVTIKFKNPGSGRIKIDIYNMQGKRIRSFLIKNKDRIQWNGMNGSGIYTGSGVYLIRVQSGETVKTYKIMQIK